MTCLKNKVLLHMARLNVLSFLISACFVDGQSWIPFYICCVNAAWLTLFGRANNWFEGGDEYDLQ